MKNVTAFHRSSGAAGCPREGFRREGKAGPVGRRRGPALAGSRLGSRAGVECTVGESTVGESTLGPPCGSGSPS